MNFLYKTLILLFFLFSNTYSQFYAEDEISLYIVEFMEIANEKILDYDEYVNPQKTFADAELEHITKLYFECYNADPVGFYNYVSEEHKKWKRRIIESNKKSKELRPWLKVYALKNQIADKNGITFTEVLTVPAFLRGKFITSTRSSYYSPDIKSNFPQMNFIFLIEDILKGDKFFSVSDTVTISTIPNIESPAPKFETDKSYLIPVRPWRGLTEYNGEVTSNHLHEYYDRWVMGKSPKIFPIENEIIKECEYFGIKDTSWIDFKKYFNETFLIFN